MQKSGIMLFRTHLAFGFLCGLLLIPFINIQNIYIYFILVLFGAGLPDIDSSNSYFGRKLGVVSEAINFAFGHRGIFHTIWFGFLVSALFWVLLGKFYGLAVLIGYASHLIIDGFTKQGINYLHPFANLHTSGFIETGSLLETVLFFIILGLTFLKIIY